MILVIEDPTMLAKHTAAANIIFGAKEAQEMYLRRQFDTACISSTALAREDIDKKGMDLSQLTGATSSYARKYALNGLFCIDDTKDADFHDNRPEPKKEEKSKGNQSAILEIINKAQTIKELDNLIQQRTVKQWTPEETKEQNEAIEKIRSFIMEASR